MLRQFGYSSLVFPSAAAFAKQSDFDGAMRVVRDINLGDGSGIKLRHRLKAAVPVIDMTGHDTLPFALLRFNPGASPISSSRSRPSHR